jgi:nucleotide-binding universal stress UspA family protein
MLGTVLVGYDGSESARDAVALGEILTERVPSDLVVARVQPQDDAVGGRSLAELQRAAALAGGRAEVVTGDSPSQGLRAASVEIGADLVIVGSCRGDGRRTVAGQVGLRLLEEAPCPVAVAPRRFARRYAPDVRTIGVGYDGSDEADEILQRAAGLAQELDAGLRVIAAIVNSSRRRLDERLAAVLASLPRPGRPASVLLDEVDAGIDLLVVGSGDLAPLQPALLGLVSTELGSRAPCPVLVIPREIAAHARSPFSTTTASG